MCIALTDLHRGIVLRLAGASFGAVLLASAAPAEPMLVLKNPALPEQSAVLELSEADLLAMPQATVRTANEFVDGTREFVGPLARDVINLIGKSQATTARTVAINDYTVDIPLEDFDRYPVIFAMFQDGERLSARDKGPIWVIYPMSEFSELQTPITNNKLIWQLVRVELR